RRQREPTARSRAASQTGGRNPQADRESELSRAGVTPARCAGPAGFLFFVPCGYLRVASPSAESCEREMPDTRQELPFTHQSLAVRADHGSLAARIIEAQDNERRKISRELHDSVGQSLVAIKMSIAKFKREHSIADNADLDQALRILDSTLAEIRTLSHLL